MSVFHEWKCKTISCEFPSSLIVSMNTQSVLHFNPWSLFLLSVSHMLPRQHIFALHIDPISSFSQSNWLCCPYRHLKWDYRWEFYPLGPLWTPGQKDFPPTSSAAVSHPGNTIRGLHNHNRPPPAPLIYERREEWMTGLANLSEVCLDWCLKKKPGSGCWVWSSYLRTRGERRGPAAMINSC